MGQKTLRLVSLALVMGSLGLGALLMFGSFIFLTMRTEDLMAGQAGLVAGSVSIAGGVIASAVLSTSSEAP